MMVKVGNFVMTPEQFSYFVEIGALDCRTPFSLEVTREEYEKLESLVEKTEKMSPAQWSIPVYIKEPK